MAIDKRPEFPVVLDVGEFPVAPDKGAEFPVTLDKMAEFPVAPG